MTDDLSQLQIRRERGQVWLTFNRPQAYNAMTFSMYEDLGRICQELEQDDEVRVVVLEGAGKKAFVAGSDINQFQHLETAQDALDYEALIERSVGRLESLGLPTIAAIDGYAVGGGALIALVCDLRICSPQARFGVPISKTLGNCLSTSSCARLVDLIGPARTKELIYTARLVDADEALELGLVNEIVPKNSLKERVAEMSQMISERAPLTLQVTKESVRRILEARRPPLSEDLIQKCYLSQDFREGVEAFLGKRKPRWKGR